MQIDLECAECGATLVGVQRRNSTTIDIELCSKCIEAAREEAFRDGQDNILQSQE